jgi:hypothetical protein
VDIFTRALGNTAVSCLNHILGGSRAKSLSGSKLLMLTRIGSMCITMYGRESCICTGNAQPFAVSFSPLSPLAYIFTCSVPPFPLCVQGSALFLDCERVGGGQPADHRSKHFGPWRSDSRRYTITITTTTSACTPYLSLFSHHLSPVDDGRQRLLLLFSVSQDEVSIAAFHRIGAQRPSSDCDVLTFPLHTISRVLSASQLR